MTDVAPTIGIKNIIRMIKTWTRFDCRPGAPNVLPNNNPKYSRQGFLDDLIAALIRNGFGDAFATELATGSYGIESCYGSPPSMITNCSDGQHGSFYGPLQIGDANMGEF